MKPVIITICLVLLAPTVCAYGAELLVPSQYPTIQAAINAAGYNDTVIIAPGTYTEPGNRDIILNKPITVRSQDGPETCIIDCNDGLNQYHRGFTITIGTLAGLTITGGFWPMSSGGGGAVTCNSGSAKLSNCILKNNYGLNGGAVFCRNSSLELFNCTITGNSTEIYNIGPGGAIYSENSSILIANCAISGNYASNGGGIYCANNSNMTIKNSIIRNNSGISPNLPGGGGGIFCDQSSLMIIASNISQNVSPHGGGINCNNVNSLLISDCNINENVATDPNYGSYNPSGGGIYFKSNQPSRTIFTIINSSISDNMVKGRECKGGGLYLEMSPATSPPQIPGIMLAGCVVARNSAQVPLNQGNSYGGGIYSSGRILLSETEVRENSAIRGGGIYNQISGINLSRCRISGNSAMFGSAIESYTGETILENCVVSGNLALRWGYMTPVIQCGTSQLLRIANCTIVGNTPPVIYKPVNPLSSITNSIIYWNSQDQKYYYELLSGLSVSYSDVQGGYAGTGNIDADPCFAISGHWDTNGTPIPYDNFWVEGDYRLTAVSPCIDTGGTVFLMDNKDLAGNPRVMGVAIDMGAYENNDTPPVAEAGPDQNVFAWIDGNASVTLDGSKSYDPDGDKLSYLWNWTVDGNGYEANGVSPTTKLPVGEHKIELIVNDKLEDSQPDDVNITVVGPVEGRLLVIPLTINRQYGQSNILTMLKLPAGITKEQIDSGYKLLLYPGGIEAKMQYITQYWDNGSGRIGIVASFDRSAFLSLVSANGNVTLYVVGRLTTGQYFFGQSIVRIFDPPPISYPPPYNK